MSIPSTYPMPLSSQSHPASLFHPQSIPPSSVLVPRPSQAHPICIPFSYLPFHIHPISISPHPNPTFHIPMHIQHPNPSSQAQFQTSLPTPHPNPISHLSIPVPSPTPIAVGRTPRPRPLPALLPPTAPRHAAPPPGCHWSGAGPSGPRAVIGQVPVRPAPGLSLVRCRSLPHSGSRWSAAAPPAPIG